MYINKSTLDAISGFTPFSASVYWTSSEVANNRAWKQNFNNGGQVNDNAKHSLSAVRAIRAVSGTTSSSLSAITAEQTAQNTAIDLKANIASPTFTGTVTTPALIVSGNTYPNTTGNANQVLTTDGSGTLSWTTSSADTVNGTANEIEVSTSDSTTTVGLPDNTIITTSLTVDGLYFGTGSGDGDNNLAVGSSMGSGTGKRNTAIGSRALESYSGTGFDNNTAVGYFNMKALSTGSGNTALGAENMFSLTTGTANTSIGNQTMLNVSTGSNNTGLGQRAGQSITTGTNNTLIGLNADVSSPNANNETVIGKGATGSGDNTVQLGNTSVTNVNTSGSITAGAITIPNTDGTSGQVLATDGSGTLSWSTPSSGSDSVYNVNTFYAELGGFVIEVRDGGKHGLVVAMQDQDVSTWYPIDNILNDATKHDANGAKFMDWRLPTIRELELIYLAKTNISPMWSGNDYWSSTQPNYANANFVNMANGFGTSSNSPGASHTTSYSKAVRAVRTF